MAKKWCVTLDRGNGRRCTRYGQKVNTKSDHCSVCKKNLSTTKPVEEVKEKKKQDTFVNT